MSTDYYLACDRHKQVVATASNTFGTAGGAGEWRMIAAFVISHRECALRVVGEHSPEVEQADAKAGPWVHWESMEIDYVDG